MAASASCASATGSRHKIILTPQQELGERVRPCCKIEDIVQADIDAMRYSFHRFRVSGDREVHEDMLEELLADIGFTHARQVDIQHVVRQVVGHCRLLEFDEFLRFVLGYVAYEREKLKHAFAAYDMDGDGSLSMAEMRGMLASIGLPPLRTVLDEAVASAAAGQRLDASQVGDIVFQYRASEGFASSEMARLRRVFDRYALAGNKSGGILMASMLEEALAQVSILDEREFPLLRRSGAAALAFPEFLACARRLRDSELQSCRDEFARCDADGSNSISEDELHELLRTLGFRPLRAVVNEIRHEVTDASDDRELDVHEFVEFLLLFRQRDGFLKEELQDLATAFERFDEDRSGEISVLEMSNLLAYVGRVKYDIDAIHLFVAQVDVNGSKELDFREFVHLMCKLREKELAKLRSVFSSFLANEDERLLASQVPDALAAAGYEEDISDYVENETTDTVDFDEFLAIANRRHHQVVSERRKRAGFSRAEVEGFRSLFRHYDDDGNGYLDAQEMAAFLKDVGMAPRTRAEQQDIVSWFDKAREEARLVLGASVEKIPGNGMITFHELVQLMRLIRKRQDSEEEEEIAKISAESSLLPEEVESFREVFVSWRGRDCRDDEDGMDRVDTLSPQGLRQMLQSLGVTVSNRQQDALTKQIEELADRDGRLRFAGFLRLMWWLMESDFAGINRRAAELVIVQPPQTAPTPKRVPPKPLLPPLQKGDAWAGLNGGQSDAPEGFVGSSPKVRVVMSAASRWMAEIGEDPASPPSPLRTPSALSSSLLRSSKSRQNHLVDVEAAFFASCKKHDHEQMNCSGFSKLCKDCHLVDAKFTAPDADIVFAGVANKQKHKGFVDFIGFKEALIAVAKRRFVPIGVVYEAVSRWWQDNHMAWPMTSTDGASWCDPESPARAWQPPAMRMSSKTKASLDHLSSYITSIPTPTCRPMTPVLEPLPPPVSRLNSGVDNHSLPEVRVTQAGKRPRRQSAPIAFPPTDKGFLGEAFKMACGQHDDMDFVDFEKLCNSCLFISDKLTILDARDIFLSSVPAGVVYLDYRGFVGALKGIAARKGIGEDVVLSAVRLWASSPNIARTARTAPKAHHLQQQRHQPKAMRLHPPNSGFASSRSPPLSRGTSSGSSGSLNLTAGSLREVTLLREGFSGTASTSSSRASTASGRHRSKQTGAAAGALPEETRKPSLHSSVGNLSAGHLKSRRRLHQLVGSSSGPNLRPVQFALHF
eukprot:TRINITY_DN19953_c0_g2_i1.p1 TRINITY_DN19953_c0_g2~~TRINITY_DN19953_c0_g2_i1.p1  ORF type:complete len:1226 (+),score=249.65 TRINITY_DN19953_c0_g2_i1:110-3787(+)